MKQTCSMIYRLGFLLFCIWAALENAFFHQQGLFGFFSDFAVLTDAICFLCILIVFIASVFSSRISNIFLRIKAICTALAVFLLMVNFPIRFLSGVSGWILKVLLPALMFVDWLLFDKKGILKRYDPLLWLLGLMLLYGLWSCLCKHFFDWQFLLDFFGGKNRLLTALLSTLAAGALMYCLDRLFSGKGSVKLWDLFSFLYRIVFICLETYALSRVCNHSLLNFLFGLKNFDRLFNFLSLLCIAVVLIICLIRNRSLHASAPFPRVKGAFTASAAVLLVGYHFVFKGGFSLKEPVSAILHNIGPLMMFFDWILFDSKGKWKPADPLLWSAAPILYGVVLLVGGTLFSMYPVLSNFRFETLVTFGILGVVACEYAVYLLDLCFKRK